MSDKLKQKLQCLYDGTLVEFRSPKKDRRGFLRLRCPTCGVNYKASDKEFSHLFEVRPRKDPSFLRIHVSARWERWKVKQVEKQYGSFQKYLDSLTLS